MATRQFESPRDIIEELEMLRHEACEFDPRNKDKPWVVVGTKCDMLHRDALYNLDSLYFRLRAKHPDCIVLGVSARFGLGIDRLVNVLRQLVHPDMLLPLSRVTAKPIPEILLPTPDMVRDAQEEFLLREREHMFDETLELEGEEPQLILPGSAMDSPDTLEIDLHDCTFDKPNNQSYNNDDKSLFVLNNNSM